MRLQHFAPFRDLAGLLENAVTVEGELKRSKVRLAMKR